MSIQTSAAQGIRHAATDTVHEIGTHVFHKGPIDGQTIMNLSKNDGNDIAKTVSVFTDIFKFWKDGWKERVLNLFRHGEVKTNAELGIVTKNAGEELSDDAARLAELERKNAELEKKLKANPEETAAAQKVVEEVDVSDPVKMLQQVVKPIEDIHNQAAEELSKEFKGIISPEEADFFLFAQENKALLSSNPDNPAVLRASEIGIKLALNPKAARLQLDKVVGTYSDGSNKTRLEEVIEGIVKKRDDLISDFLNSRASKLPFRDKAIEHVASQNQTAKLGFEDLVEALKLHFKTEPLTTKESYRLTDLKKSLPSGTTIDDLASSVTKRETRLADNARKLANSTEIPEDVRSDARREAVEGMIQIMRRTNFKRTTPIDLNGMGSMESQLNKLLELEANTTMDAGDKTRKLTALKADITTVIKTLYAGSKKKHDFKDADDLLSKLKQAEQDNIDFLKPKDAKDAVTPEAQMIVANRIAKIISDSEEGIQFEAGKIKEFIDLHKDIANRANWENDEADEFYTAFERMLKGVGLEPAEFTKFFNDKVQTTLDLIKPATP